MEQQTMQHSHMHNSISNISRMRCTTIQQSVTVHKKTNTIQIPGSHIQSNLGTLSNLRCVDEMNPFRSYCIARPSARFVNQPRANKCLHQLQQCYNRLPQNFSKSTPIPSNVRLHTVPPTTHNFPHQQVCYPVQTGNPNINISHSHQLVASGSHVVIEPFTGNPSGRPHCVPVAGQTGADVINTISGYVTPSPSPEQLLTYSETSIQHATLDKNTNASMSSQESINRAGRFGRQPIRRIHDQNTSYSENVFRYQSPTVTQAEAPMPTIIYTAREVPFAHGQPSNSTSHLVRPVATRRYPVSPKVIVAATYQIPNRMHSMLDYRQPIASNNVSNSIRNANIAVPRAAAYSPVSDTDDTLNASEQSKSNVPNTTEQSGEKVSAGQSVENGMRTTKESIIEKLLLMPEGTCSLQSISLSSKQCTAKKRKADAFPCISKQRITADRIETRQESSVSNSSNAEFAEPFPAGYLRNSSLDLESRFNDSNKSQETREYLTDDGFLESTINDPLTIDEVTSSSSKETEKDQVRKLGREVSQSSSSGEMKVPQLEEVTSDSSKETEQHQVSKLGREVSQSSSSGEMKVPQLEKMSNERRAYIIKCVPKLRSIQPCTFVKNEKDRFSNNDKTATDLLKPLSESGDFNQKFLNKANCSSSGFNQTKVEHESLPSPAPFLHSNNNNNLEVDKSSELSIGLVVEPFQKRARIRTPTSKPIRMDLLYYANLYRLRQEARNGHNVYKLPRQTTLTTSNKQLNEIKLKSCSVVLTDLKLTLF